MDTNRRSALHFAVFIVFALWMTLFVLDKARETVEEIKRLQSTPVRGVGFEHKST